LLEKYQGGDRTDRKVEAKTESSLTALRALSGILSFLVLPDGS